MKILVTGAKGFVGKNLCAQLHNIKDNKARWYNLPEPIEAIYEYEADSNYELLDDWCKDCSFVFNLAGINRPKEPSEYMKGNFDFTTTLLNSLKKNHNLCPIMLSSSSQAAFDNPYGISKKASEELLFQYAKETGSKVYIYRFPNIFGKWCRPNYNSVIATFCHNIANGLPIRIDDLDVMLSLVYIDDVVDELINCLCGNEYREGKFCYVPNVNKVRLGDIVELLFSYDVGRSTLQVPNVSNSFKKNLYTTFVSYLPESKISYPLDMKFDLRGSFTEFIRTENHGQISINISKPKTTKGQHWHNNSVERFLVVSGKGLIQLRKVGVNENGKKYPVINYYVDSSNLRAIEMIPGYTHNLINLSDTEDLVTIIWGNACFDPNRPDTYFDPVE